MSRTTEEQIAILQLHRENLANSKTFEEYRDHHAAYVDLLIERLEASRMKERATMAFADRVSWQVVAAAAGEHSVDGEQT